MRRALLPLALLVLGCLTPLGCSSDDPAPAADTATTALFDASALASPEGFYNFPYPSDLRLTPEGTPDLTGFPYPTFLETVNGIRKAAMDRPGFPVVPVAYFRFNGAIPPLAENDVVAAHTASNLLLIDIDPEGAPGTLVPVVATTPPEDPYVPSNLLAVAARPGFVLHPNRSYAFVVKRTLGDAAGKALGVPEYLATLAAGKAPSGPEGAAALALYTPLFETLDTLGVPRSDVAAATVFTTGDVVQRLADWSTALVAKHPLTLESIAVDPDDGASHERYCELHGVVRYPQFQTGTPPYDSEGRFVIGSDGLPEKQGEEAAPFVISLPLGPMPAAGFPLVLYFHGSGGLSTSVVDRGTWHPESDPTKCPEGTTDEWLGVSGCNTKGEGPSHVVAEHGFAAAGSALPVNPERLPGAAETEYLNFNNLAAGSDLFQQGAIEQRMFLEALSKLEITPDMVASCAGLSLPAGETSYHFDAASVFGQGQSMGGQYTNLVSAIEPRIRASVPTGAGGYWSHFILHTTLIDNVASIVGTVVLGTQAELTFMHPALSVFETAWEPVDPMVYMPRLARRPLPGHPVRSIYEPVGLGDSYFPTETYDAMVLAYGHNQAGTEVWPTMQEALSLAGLEGILPYPVSDNRTSEDGTPYTGVVVQYEGDGVYDPHALYSQLDEVKYQYGCFLKTALDGKARVLAPKALGSGCQ